MFKRDKLRALLTERLTAAAEDIFRIFEETIQEYEQGVFRSKEGIEQKRGLDGWKAPLQISVHEDGAPSEQDGGEENSELCEGDQEALQIKEEQEEEPWTSETSDKQEEADRKDSVFNIIYVQRSEEDERRLPDEDQQGELPAECLSRDVPGSSGPTSDCEQSDDTDHEWSDVNRKSPQHDKPFACRICDKNFRIKSILTRHMKTHTGEKPHCCGVCGKSFIQRSYLQTHMNSHSGQKPHACGFCGRGFTQVGNMNAHMRIHTGEKAHRCTDCGKSFREKADLIKHAIIHTGQKPYVCSVCSVKFSAQSNLTRHMKTHSGERPHCCAACGKRFIRRSHLIIHMKTHQGEDL